MARVTIKKVEQLVKERFNPPADLSVFKEEDGRIYAVSRAGGINCGVDTDDPEWERTVVNHIKWQLGI